jgi:hypothetical protein
MMHKHTDDDDLLTVSGVSTLAVEYHDPLTPAMVRKHADNQRLPHLKTPSGMRLFRRGDAERFLAVRRAQRGRRG